MTWVCKFCRKSNVFWKGTCERCGQPAEAKPENGDVDRWKNEGGNGTPAE